MCKQCFVNIFVSTTVMMSLVALNCSVDTTENSDLGMCVMNGQAMAIPVEGVRGLWAGVQRQAAPGATEAAMACCLIGPLSVEIRLLSAEPLTGPARCSLLHGTCSPS